jgi:hypothetical protein
MSIKRLCIIPCGSAKVWDKVPQAGPTQSQFVYTGVFATTCQRYAKSYFKDWIILSAKYGFLFPDDIVEGPYNISFNKPAEDTIKIETLRDQALMKGLYDFDEIVVLGGMNYIERAKSVFINGQNIVTPLSDCSGIGYMLQKLSRALENGVEIVIDSVQPNVQRGWDKAVRKPETDNSEVIGKRGNRKYGPLYYYLRGQNAQEVTLPLEEMEGILGFTLPSSARQHRPWWANSHSHSHASSWLNAGWEVIQVNMPTSVRFYKAY